ncbi:MAG: radical SAM protein, partial [Acidobacteria bacterium]|nr:radical SAM protein [Acidobacteriota bacterium]
CVHCYLDHEDYGELTTVEVKRVLDELAAAGTLFLTFSGGEIFLRQDFFELLEYARRLHFDLNLKTNGLLVTEERAARLKKLGVAKIQISIYSTDPKIHDAITKAPGSHARSIAAVKHLKAQGLSVKIACPLMAQNAGGYAAVLQLAEEMDVVCVLDMTITPKMDGDKSLLALRKSEQELLPILQNAKLNPLPPSGADGEAGGSYDNIPCSAGHNSCYISPYGDVYPCVQMPLPTGNVRQAGFAEVWYGSREMNRVREIRESTLQICTECSIRKYCHRCPGIAYLEDGDLVGPSERACELAEANARLAGVVSPVSEWHARKKLEGRSDVLPLFPILTSTIAACEEAR